MDDNLNGTSENDQEIKLENPELDLDAITKQLQEFECSMKDFDSLVTSVCEENTKFTSDDILN